MQLRSKRASNVPTGITLVVALGVLVAACTSRTPATTPPGDTSISTATSSGGTASAETQLSTGSTTATGAQTDRPSSPKHVPALGLIDNNGVPVEASARPLLRAIHQAAARRDLKTLLRLCAPCADPAFARKQAAILTETGMLDRLLQVLSTHPATTDGYSFPGFAFGGFHSRYDIADAKALGVPAPASRVGPPPTGYRGIRTGFEDPNANGTGHWTWDGISVV